MIAFLAHHVYIILSFTFLNKIETLNMWAKYAAGNQNVHNFFIFSVRSLATVYVFYYKTELCPYVQT